MPVRLGPRPHTISRGRDSQWHSSNKKSFRDKIGNPRSIYDDFLVDQDLVDGLTSESRKGYIIPVFAGGRDPIVSKRTVLLGDAAALVDPFLGEDFYYAIRSGQLAAHVIGDALRDGGTAAPTEYQHLVAAEMYPEFRATRNIAFFVHLFPPAAYAVLKRPRERFVESYFDLLRGEAGYAPGIVALLIGSAASVLCRPRLAKKTLMGGALFLGFYALFMVGLVLLTPGYIDQVWNLPALSGVLVYGIPLEELLFAVAFGMYCSGVYEHFTWTESVQHAEG